MDNIKFKIDFIKYNNSEVTNANIFNHIVIFGYTLIALTKKFKMKKQMEANKLYIMRNHEKYKESNRKKSKKQYDTNPEYRQKKRDRYYAKKLEKDFEL